MTQRWYCPRCKIEAEATGQGTALHKCATLAGLSVPLVPYGVSAKIEAHEREDYVGSENVRYNDEGRPIMAVVTTRNDGQDCTVYAPTAQLDAENAG